MPRSVMGLRRWLIAGACAAALVCSPSPASADPISAAIVTAIGLTGTAATVASFVISTGLQLAGAFALSKLSTPKQKQQERQASVTTINVGEVPREAVFGRVCSGGSLMNAANFGGQYGTDWEVLQMALADHPIDALEGYIIDSTYYPFTGNGLQPGFNGCLDIEFVDGSVDTIPPPRFMGPLGLGILDRARGVTKVFFAYKFDEKVWPQGRPSVKWVFRAKRCYDPRLDSTVPGGSGPHRWSDPATWTWTENAAICRYNWVRGIYALDQVDQPAQLLVGRGLTAIEAPPERVFAAANVCDEAVALKAGGTEPRYRVSAVIRADETFDTTEQMFAAAMAGVIVQREGGVEIEPGQAKSTVVEITDADLVLGEKIAFDRFLPDTQRVNSVVGRYVAPDQDWSDHAAPIRRSILDIEADGGPRETTLSLGFVNSGSQSQRCAEIERRMGRLERRASTVLGPRFSGLEEGDWIGWTSDRYHGGNRVVYRIDAWARDASWRRSLALREAAASAFGWTSADEITPGTVPPPEPSRPGPLALAGVIITVGASVGSDGSSAPAIRATWVTPVDPAVTGVRLEVRIAGEADATPTTLTTRESIDAGVMVTTNGVAASSALEARLVPLTDPSREVEPSDWTAVTSGATTSGGSKSVPWSGVVDDDGGRPADGADVTGENTALNTQFVSDIPASQVVSDLTLNAEEIAAEILRGALARAYIDALTHLAGVPIGTVLLNEKSERIEGDEAIAQSLNLLGAKSGDGLSWVMDASVALAGSGYSLASFLSYVASTLGDGTTTVTELKESLSGTFARWAMSVQALGPGGVLKAISGIESTVDGVTSTSAINFIADYYRFVRLDGSSPVYLLTYDEPNNRWTFGADIYAQKIIADSIDTVNLKIGGVTTNRIEPNGVTAPALTSGDYGGAYGHSGGGADVCSVTITGVGRAVQVTGMYQAKMTSGPGDINATAQLQGLTSGTPKSGAFAKLGYDFTHNFRASEVVPVGETRTYTIRDTVGPGATIAFHSFSLDVFIAKV